MLRLQMVMATQDRIQDHSHVASPPELSVYVYRAVIDASTDTYPQENNNGPTGLRRGW
jgi:hypothetical protein